MISPLDSSKAVHIKCSGENADDLIVLKLHELAFAHHQPCSADILQLVPPRVQLHRKNMQPALMSTPMKFNFKLIS